MAKYPCKYTVFVTVFIGGYALSMRDCIISSFFPVVDHAITHAAFHMDISLIKILLFMCVARAGCGSTCIYDSSYSL